MGLSSRGDNGGNDAPGPAPRLPAGRPHDSLHKNVIAAAIVCWTLAAGSVALRIYTRGWIIRALGISDWCMIASVIFSAASMAGELDQVAHGSGQHVWDLNLNDTSIVVGWIRAGWYSLLFYTLSLCFTKTSILCLYLRVFTFQWVRRLGQALLAVVLITNLYTVTAIFLACVPLRAYWDFASVKSSYCNDQPVWWSNTGLHMATDLLIFLLPLPVVWRLQLPPRQRYALLAIFGLGFLTCLVSFLRLWNLVRTQTDPDFTYAAATVALWTIVEVNAAIVVAAVMTLKPLANRFFPCLLGAGSRRGESRRPSLVDPRRSPPTIGSRTIQDRPPRPLSWTEVLWRGRAGEYAMVDLAHKDRRCGGEGMGSLDSARSFDLEAHGRVERADSVSLLIEAPPAVHCAGRNTASTFYTTSSEATMGPARSQG